MLCLVSEKPRVSDKTWGLPANIGKALMNRPAEVGGKSKKRVPIRLMLNISVNLVGQGGVYRALSRTQRLESAETTQLGRVNQSHLSTPRFDDLI